MVGGTNQGGEVFSINSSTSSLSTWALNYTNMCTDQTKDTNKVKKILDILQTLDDNMVPSLGEKN